jgi:hypothetical protein
VKHNSDGQLEVWVTRTYERTASVACDEYCLLRPNSDVIWPGAALQGSSIRRATSDPIIARRGSGRVIITNITGTQVSSISIPEMSMSAVMDAANTIIAKQSSSFPAFLHIAIQRVRTKEELQMAMSANVDFFFASAAASFSFRQSDSVARFLVTLTQSFYSLVYERPATPGEFFNSSVTGEQLGAYVGPGNPPVYISQVNYGRVFYLLVEADVSSSELAASISTDFIFGGVSGSGKHVANLNNLTVQAFAIGGDANMAIQSVLGGLGNLTSFLNSLRQAGVITSGVPLSYNVRTVSQDRLVKNAFTTHYTYSESVPTGVGLATPVPLSPIADRKLPNGCSVTTRTYTWTFSWSSCPGATNYEIVIGQRSLGGIKDVTLGATTSYSVNQSTPFADAYTSNWHWIVRAKVGGYWGDFSPAATFTLEPVNSGCETGVRLYDYPNYGGTSRFLTDDTPDLDLGTINFDDVATSVKLLNIRGVWLYDGRNYTGACVHITSDAPDLREPKYNFDGLTGSVKLEK